MLAETLMTVVARVLEGLTSPRAAARAVIDARPDVPARLTMVAAASVVQAFVYTLFGLLVGGGGSRFGLGGLLVLVGVGFINYVITATVAFHVGRRFGGRGDQEAVATAVAWHALLSAALSPLQVAALSGRGDAQEMSLFGLLSLFAYAALNVWLLAACIAEAHRFQSTGRVAAATVGLFFLLGAIVWALVGGLTPA